MKRKAINDFLRWKNSNSPMPLMVIGARQVGKTWALEQFCRTHYQNFVYINLESEPALKEIFELQQNPEDIVNSIAILKGIKIDPAETVIFLDEIQLSEKAVTALKYFNESSVNYNIVCAGSMLGVALNRFKSAFPVGKVYRYYMYPMDFEEYLWALGEELLSNEIHKSYLKNQALLSPIHDKALKLYKDFLYVGGMPASVNEFVNCGKLLNQYSDHIKQGLVEDYMADMSKYTSGAEHMRITRLYRSIPKQLGRDNNKFSYKVIEEKGNKRLYETPIEWLLNSFIVRRCTLTELPQLPLITYEKENYFKLYMSDTGLLTELAGLSKKDIYSDDLKLYSGMLSENHVAVALTANNIPLHYWKSKHNAELDFIVALDGQIIPIEVKAATNTKSKSLKVYMEKYQPTYAIRISGKNFGMANGIRSIPLYAAHLVGKE